PFPPRARDRRRSACRLILLAGYCCPLSYNKPASPIGAAPARVLRLATRSWHLSLKTAHSPSPLKEIDRGSPSLRERAAPRPPAPRRTRAAPGPVGLRADSC